MAESGCTDFWLSRAEVGFGVPRLIYLVFGSQPVVLRGYSELEGPVLSTVLCQESCRTKNGIWASCMQRLCFSSWN